ncbi:MAG TPA: hypothetical protein EYQ26_00145 [Rhodospirillales bacterium]|jgi:hypothetical protein|nr:hypothetical protein [Rhodospirillales bacterium]HIL75937.1 hypothetical protein [Rhodospirillales bacterium]
MSSSQIANNVMLRAINEHSTVVLPVHDSFICTMEFKDILRDLMTEEYNEVMKTEMPPGIDMKESEYYWALKDWDEDNPYTLSKYSPDPFQKIRKHALQKQAYSARFIHGIVSQVWFDPESKEAAYAPQNADDVL